jgi:hypothetical protein
MIALCTCAICAALDRRYPDDARQLALIDVQAGGVATCLRPV